MTATLITEWSADTAAKLWADAGKSTPISDGSVCRAMEASAGSYVGSDFVASSDATAPTYRANYASSGYPALEFDGTNDVMTAAHDAAFNAPSLTMVLVFEFLTFSAADRLLLNKYTSSGWGGGPGIAILSGSGMMVGGGAGFGEFMIAVPTATTRYVVMLRCPSGRARTLQRNNFIFGTLTATGSPSTNTSPWQLGSGTVGGAYPAHIAAFLVQLWDGIMELDQAQSVLYESASRFGVSDIAAPASSGGLMTARGFEGGFAG